MTETEFEALAALALDVAFGLAPWASFGDRVRQALDASVVTLMVGPADGSSFVDYMAPGDGGASEAARFKPLDPSLPKSVAIAAHRLDLKHVAQVFEMLPEPTFRRSAYYSDFARRAGMYHRLGFSGIRGGPQMAPFGVHRAQTAQPFSENDRRDVLALKPMVKQALRLRPRVATGIMTAGAGLAVLDAIGEALFILDGERRVLAANSPAERLCAAADAPLRLARGAGAAARAVLGCRSRDLEHALDRLVRAIAFGGKAGGMMRLPDIGANSAGVLLQAGPVPARLIDGERLPGAEPGLALLLVRDLRRTARLHAASVRETFALSASETAVACAIGEGRTALEIAADRAVSLDTVRTQIRIVLRKTGATGLRDLERILALLPRAP